jgi:DNA repair exonuclease SbcCD ATPase subunit
VRIINLHIENVQGIKVADITPTGNSVIISGENAQGKSSVLDAIQLALEGLRKSNNQIVREGAEKGLISIDLGDIKVTRKINKDNTASVVVESKDGSVYKSPQAVLDSFLGKVSFDPLAFSRLDSKTQIQALKDFLSIDFEKLDAEKSEIYNNRTVLGRELKQAESQLKELVFDDKAPSEPLVCSSIIDAITASQSYNDDYFRRQRDLKQTELLVADLTKKLEDAKLHLDLQRKQLEGENPVPTEEIEAMKTQLRDAEAINNTVAMNKRYLEKKSVVASISSQVDKITERLADIYLEKREILSKVKMPLEGLGFSDDGVVFNGIEISQCSTAEQLKISTSIAMALNPKIRVLRIKDGAFLDDASMAWIKELAVSNDYQLWIERVGVEPMSVVIKDGTVVS